MKRFHLASWAPAAVAGLITAAVCVMACSRIVSEQERVARTLVSNYMVKDSALNNQFELNSRGLALYDVDTLNPSRVPEAVIYWDEADLLQRMLRAMPIDTVLRHYRAKGETHWNPNQFKDLPNAPTKFRSTDPNLPLKGMRIALDPGHVGGKMDYAQFMEEKYVRIKPDAAMGITEEIGFCEGNLALGTSLILAEKLRAAGAEVLLTREKEGLNAFGGTFEQWLQGEVVRHERWLTENGRAVNRKDSAQWLIHCAGANYARDYDLKGKDADFWANKASLAQIHRIPFLKAEFLERARIINGFKPHVTFIIHYNVGGNNPATADGYRRALPEDYCMAFIPGAFMRGELKTPEDRLAFAAKVFTDDIRQSQSLSAAVVKAHEKILGIPVMAWDDSLTYLRNASLRTPEVGVFARNLQLTRLIHGTLCFGESLYQDNAKEAMAMNAKDFTLPGMTTPVPNRIRAVADAYYQGLIDWLASE
ncbi:MAG: hypothetical protein U0176_13695 [Bacteroidia bacterium]